MEQNRNGTNFPEQFAASREFWKKAVNDGRARATEFYSQVFEGPDSEVYEGFADRQMIDMVVEGMMQEAWIGNGAETKHIDDGQLPTNESLSE